MMEISSRHDRRDDGDPGEHVKKDERQRCICPNARELIQSYLFRRVKPRPCTYIQGGPVNTTVLLLGFRDSRFRDSQ
ncbi:hypothetical protein GOP47_0019589 [Adiantum capillus-veneris]|uniref:Uncharacterized protein n=1 Tax=Adiantum capillus-veneris TaxID=13818 RepID=A0A9D4UBB6_ADICA|nr:hypothetical protein GOP47_0019589 [Adiantum capillus-veneris]